MRKRSAATKMARLVGQWRQSGDTQAGFARRHGIPPWTFWYWCRKLAATTAPSSSDRDVFVPVRVADEDTAMLEVVLASGDRVRVRPGVPVEVVHGAIAALRARC